MPISIRAFAIRDLGIYEVPSDPTKSSLLDPPKSPFQKGDFETLPTSLFPKGGKGGSGKNASNDLTADSLISLFWSTACLSLPGSTSLWD